MYTNYYFLNVVPNILFNLDNPRNTLLQIKVIFNIGNTIYIFFIYKIISHLVNQIRTHGITLQKKF